MRVFKLDKNLLSAANTVNIPTDISPIKQALIKGLSGAIGAGISSVLLFPAVNLKTRLMLEADDDNKDASQDKKTLMERLHKIIKEEGLQGLFTGVVPYFIYSVGSYGVFFVSYEIIKKMMGASTSREVWMSSFIGGIITVFMSSPLNMITTHIIAAKKKEGRVLSYYQAVKEIIQKYGLKGFYRGLLFSLILVINPTINMYFFEYFKEFYPQYLQKDLALFLSGASSKLIATLFTYPIQILKTNMQGGSNRKAMQAIQYILSNFGPLGFYKGISVKIIHSVSNAALMLFLYERINEGVIKAITSA